jgi:hypothetical protein
LGISRDASSEGYTIAEPFTEYLYNQYTAITALDPVDLTPVCSYGDCDLSTHDFIAVNVEVSRQFPSVAAYLKMGIMGFLGGPPIVGAGYFLGSDIPYEITLLDCTAGECEPSFWMPSQNYVVLDNGTYDMAATLFVVYEEGRVSASGEQASFWWHPVPDLSGSFALASLTPDVARRKL